MKTRLFLSKTILYVELVIALEMVYYCCFGFKKNVYNINYMTVILVFFQFERTALKHLRSLEIANICFEIFLGAIFRRSIDRYHRAAVGILFWKGNIRTYVGMFVAILPLCCCLAFLIRAPFNGFTQNLRS